MRKPSTKVIVPTKIHVCLKLPLLAKLQQARRGRSKKTPKLTDGLVFIMNDVIRDFPQ